MSFTCSISSSTLTLQRSYSLLVSSPSLPPSLQFFSIILVIFISEVAAGVVVLAYSSFVSSPTSPLPLSFHSLPHHTLPSLLPSPFLFLYSLSFVSWLVSSLSVSLRHPLTSSSTLCILSPCKFSITAVAIIELLALCPPHYIRLLNDSGRARGRARCL